jgi:hypothetical protein
MKINDYKIRVYKTADVSIKIGQVKNREFMIL